MYSYLIVNWLTNETKRGIKTLNAAYLTISNISSNSISEEHLKTLTTRDIQNKTSFPPQLLGHEKQNLVTGKTFKELDIKEGSKEKAKENTKGKGQKIKKRGRN